MSATVPGIGGSNQQLERRIAALERLFMSYSKIRAEVFDPNMQKTMEVEILAKRAGTKNGEELQWKTTRVGGNSLAVKGGTISTQGRYSPPYEVPEVEELKAEGDGYVILTITRSKDSREITGEVISYAKGDIPNSDYNSQIVPLAKVTFSDESIDKIIPLQFEELHIFEDLAVVAGEFRLVGLLMAGRDHYEPPSA